jgi:hypothetical protein
MAQVLDKEDGAMADLRGSGTSDTDASGGSVVFTVPTSRWCPEATGRTRQR